MDPIETYTRAGLTVRIYQDTDATSPDEWSDDGIFLSYDCRRVGAGRKGYARNGARYTDDYHVYTLDVNDGPYTILYLGDIVSPRGEDEEGDEEYDTTPGYVYVSKEEWPEEDKARTAATSLVETWNQYLSGDVYGYVVEGEEGEQVDSCWGFYGIETAREEANGAADAHAAHLATLDRCANLSPDDCE